MKKTLVCLMFCGVLSHAAEADMAALNGDVKFLFGLAKNNIIKAAQKMPEEHYGFKPAEGVRTYVQLLGHIADASYMFCKAVEGEQHKPAIEKTVTTKAAMVDEVTKAMAYCDSVVEKSSGDALLRKVKFFGRERTVVGVLDFNSVHLFEHYGNLVTYMRMKGIVPPSSER